MAFVTFAILYVTVLPGHTGVVPVIDPGTAGVPGFTVIGILMPVAVEGLTQGAVEVKTTFTISPFANDVEVYVALFVPTFPPFNFH